MAPLSQFQVVKRCTNHLEEHLDVPLLVKHGVSLDLLTAKEGRTLLAALDKKEGQLEAVLCLLEVLEEKNNCLNDLLKVLRYSVSNNTQHSHYQLISSLERLRPREIPQDGVAESGCGSDHSSCHQSSLQSLGESLDDFSHSDACSLHSSRSEMVTGLRKSFTDTPPGKACTMPAPGGSWRNNKTATSSMKRKRHSTEEQSFNSQCRTTSCGGIASPTADREVTTANRIATEEMDRMDKRLSYQAEKIVQLEKEVAELKKKQTLKEGEQGTLKKKEQGILKRKEQGTLKKKEEKPLELSDIVFTHEVEGAHSQDKSSSSSSGLRTLPSAPHRRTVRPSSPRPANRRHSDIL